MMRGLSLNMVSQALTERQKLEANGLGTQALYKYYVPEA